MTAPTTPGMGSAVPNTPATPVTPDARLMADARAAADSGRSSDDQSIGSLIAEVADDVSKLFRQEVELAKAELKVEASKAGKAAGMLGGAGFAGYMVALFASLALMFGLDAIMPLGWAAVIVAVIWGIAGAVLYANGRKKMKDVSPVPQQTVETLKEDAQWLKNPTG
ncbi:MAG TPA: phage holin family protein [Pilimelia sp.]|nr:phage holin family protein [Pilimelia sp.]